MVKSSTLRRQRRWFAGEIYIWRIEPNFSKNLLAGHSLRGQRLPKSWKKSTNLLETPNKSNKETTDFGSILKILSRSLASALNPRELSEMHRSNSLQTWPQHLFVLECFSWYFWAKMCPNDLCKDCISLTPCAFPSTSTHPCEFCAAKKRGAQIQLIRW